MSFVRITAFGVLLFFLFTLLLIGLVGSKSTDDYSVVTPEITVSTGDLKTWNQGSSIIIIARTQGIEGRVNVTFQVDDPAGNSILILTEPTNQMGEAVINFNLPGAAAIGNYTVTATSSYNSSSISSNPLTVHVSEQDEEYPDEVKSSYNWLPLVLGILIIVLLTLIVVMAIHKRKRRLCSDDMEEVDELDVEVEYMPEIKDKYR